MEHFEYTKPEDNYDEPSAHRIELIIDDRVVGEALLEYSSKPFPLYQVSTLQIENFLLGRGYGTKIMGNIESLLKKKGRAGVIVDAIHTASPASGMYARRGWVPVPGEDSMFAYNLPVGAKVEQLKGFDHRKTKFVDRVSRRK